MVEIKNNLEFAQYLEKQTVADRQSEYSRLTPTLKFKPKSFGFLMTRYEKWKKDHGTSPDSEN